MPTPYIPGPTHREVADWLIARRALLIRVEIACLALFWAAIALWGALADGS
jgi:hypothetical protein